MVPLLGQAQAEGGLVIAAAVYAELLAHPRATPQFVDEFLISTRIAIDSIWVNRFGEMRQAALPFMLSAAGAQGVAALSGFLWTFSSALTPC
jgi:hypothetical protein